MSSLNKTFIVNGRIHNYAVEDDIPLLWFLRDTLGLTGTKYSCGIGLCGSCMVLVDNKAVNSCQIKAASVANKSIITIEGLSQNSYSSVQQAWIDEQVPQCGYCQSGQIIAATALLDNNPRPSSKQIDEAMSAVLCRCGTYQRVKRAIHRVINSQSSKS